MRNIILIATLSAAVFGVQAGVLVKYDFNDHNVAPDVVHANITSENIQSNALGSIDARSGALNTVQGDRLANANSSLKAGYFFSFEITVTGLATGETINLDQISWDYTPVNHGKNTRLAFATGDDLDTYNANDISANVGGAPGQTSNLTESLTDISALQGLKNGDTVDFRFAVTAYRTKSNSDFDNIVLTGTVASSEPQPEPEPEPESKPETLGLVIAFSGAILFIRRRII